MVIDKIIEGDKAMMKRLSLLAVMLIITGLGLGAKVVPMPDLLKPDDILLDKDYMYVVEKTTVSIYSLKDLKLVKKFGKQGSGPQEFHIAPIGQFNFVDVHVLPDRLLINSVHKISYFSKNGDFISEKKLKFWPRYLTPLGKGFAGRYEGAENNIYYHTYLIVNENMEMPQLLFKDRNFFQPGQNLRINSRRPSHFLVHDDQLLIEEKEKGDIHVFDATGKKLYTIDHPFKQVPFTKEDEKNLVDFFMADPVIRPQYEATKNLTVFDPYFPFIWRMAAVDHKLYVLTFEKQGDKRNFYIFDLAQKGKFIKTVFLPVTQMDGEKPYPFAIAPGKIYNMLENLDEESWELHITDFN